MIQGFWVIQGIQDIQGIQGIQGIHAIQGIQDIQGIQGIHGIQGIQGIQGILQVPSPYWHIGCSDIRLPCCPDEPTNTNQGSPEETGTLKCSYLRSWIWPMAVTFLILHQGTMQEVKIQRLWLK